MYVADITYYVHSSLQSLARLGVFCTEPFRIPLAGKVGKRAEG